MEEVGREERERGGEHMDSEARREGQRGNRRNMEAKEENVGGRKVESGVEKGREWRGMRGKRSRWRR